MLAAGRREYLKSRSGKSAAATLRLLGLDEILADILYEAHAALAETHNILIQNCLR